MENNIRDRILNASNQINSVEQLQPQQQVQQARPVVYYQTSTTNKSFITMQKVLAKLGIKENRQHLLLFNPALAGISPFDPNLSRQMKIAVLREVECNYWYFIREVVRIPAPGSPGGIPYRLHRGNMALNFCLIRNLPIYFEISRQQGKTISSLTYYLWVYNFATNNAKISFLNKKMKDSKENLQRLKDIRSLLPTYLQMDQSYSMVNNKKLKVSTSVETMQNAVNHNEVRTVPSARNEITAGNLLRGQSITFLYADEWAFIPYNKSIYVNSIPALQTVQEASRKAGKPYGILITSTPGRLTTDEGRFANQMRLSATKFDELWYDLSYDQIMQIINSNRLSQFVYIRFDYKQLGRDEAWFEKQCRDMNWSWDDIRREVLLEWSEDPENSPFTKEQLDTISHLVHPPVDKKLILGKYVLNIYNNKIPLKSNFTPKYPPIIGVDPSGGLNRDLSCLTIIDSYTTSVIADMSSNSISPLDMARAIYEIVMKWYPNAIINVERNGGFGTSIIAALIKSKVKNNLYYEIKDKVVEEVSDGIRISRKTKKTKVFGLNSNKEVRNTLIEILRQRVESHKDKIVSPVIYNEIKQMEVKRSGKVEHSDNSHDDQVFSWLMALYVWYEGVELKERYNIDKGSIKTDDDIDEVVEADFGVDNSSIVQSLEEIQSEDETTSEVNKTINLLEAGKGILFKDYIHAQRQMEEQYAQMMIQNKVFKQAFANANYITPEEVDMLFDSNGIKNIPDSVLLKFNSDEKVDPSVLNPIQFNPDDYHLDKN